MLSSKVFFPISLATALLIVSAAPSPAQFSHIGNNTMANSPVKADSLTPEEARAIALEAYLYGYPLVTTEITGLAFTNTVEPNPKTLQAPLNQLVNQPAYPPADYKGVTAPNADTLYSAGFIDVSKEPIVFSYPDMGKRYFLFPIYDFWTTVISVPGARTTGGAARNVLITGPSWQGKVPQGMTHVQSPTNQLFIIGRVYADGTPADFEKVHALQKQFKLVPLSQFGKPYTPPAGQTGGPYTPKEIVRDVIAKMSTVEYFNFMAQAMKANPPLFPQDQAIISKMAKLGIVPGQKFDWDNLDPKVQKVLENVGQTVLFKLDEWQKTGGKMVNGWLIPGAGNYAENYTDRAAISAFGWGANLPEDAVYPTAKVDAKGQPLTGSNVYKMNFKKGETPPVDGFWSITMYDDQFYFYPNPLNKLTLSPRNNLQYNADGSLDLYFAHQQPPNVPPSNWLPAPKENFILMMRLYWPKEKAPSILPTNNPTWTPPPIERLN